MSAGPLGNRTRTENKSGADGVNDAEDKIGTKRDVVINDANDDDATNDQVSPSPNLVIKRDAVIPNCDNKEDLCTGNEFHGLISQMSGFDANAFGFFKNSKCEGGNCCNFIRSGKITSMNTGYEVGISQVSSADLGDGMWMIDFKLFCLGMDTGQNHEEVRSVSTS